MKKQTPGSRVAAMRAAREAQYAREQRAQRVAAKAAIVEPLSLKEVADLEGLEAQIREGFGAFMNVGQALAEVRERRLYRATHATFEAYCKEKWDMGRSYANKQIRAADAVASLGTIGTQPDSERVARPLTALPPKVRRKAWGAAVRKAAGRPVTAKVVKEVVQEVTGAPEKLPAAQEADRPVCPMCGRPLPKGGVLKHTQ